MDINKLTKSEQIIAGSGIALLIFSFFPWYGVDTSLGSASRNGWDYFLFGIIPVVLAVVMVAQIAITRFTETKLPEIPIAWGQVHMVAGILAAALVVLKLLIGDDVYSFDLDRKFGIFLAALAGIGLAVGGFLRSKDPEDTVASPPMDPPSA
jgi:hypothetical protein